MQRAGLAFWESVSKRFRYSPPLTPSETDLAWYRLHAGRCLEASRASTRRALLLGVTPGIAAMPRPADAVLVPVDWSDGMIRNVLPHAGAQRALPVRGDWRELPLADASCAVAFCDLFFPALPSFRDGELALRELARVLEPGATLCIRCFLRLDPAEAPEELLRELAEGRTPDLVVFYMRLAAAVHAESREGVSVDRVWTLFDRRFPDRDALTRLYGTRSQALQSIERWKDLSLRYAFLSLGELTALAGPYFELAETIFPDYIARRQIARVALRRR